MMDPVTQASLTAAIRALMMVFGTLAATMGYKVENEMLTELGGYLTVLVAFGWSMWDKYRVEQQAKAREAAAVNAGIIKANATVGQTQLVTPAAVPAILEEAKL